MLDADLIETEIDSAEVYKGQLLHAYSDRVRLPDGQESTREYVRHPGAVLVLALLDNGRLLLERQFRYPLRRVPGTGGTSPPSIPASATPTSTSRYSSPGS